MKLEIYELEDKLKTKIIELIPKMKKTFENMDFSNFDNNFKSLRIMHIQSVYHEGISYDYRNNTLYFNDTLSNVTDEVFSHIILRELLNIASSNNNVMGLMDQEENNRGLNSGIREVIINIILKDNYKEFQTKYLNSIIITKMIGLETTIKYYFNNNYDEFILKFQNIIDDKKKINLLIKCLDISYDLEENYKKFGKSKYNLFEINAQKLIADFYYAYELKNIENNLYDNESKLKESIEKYTSCLINSKNIDGFGYDSKNYMGIDEQVEVLKNKMLNLFEYLNETKQKGVMK